MQNTSEFALLVLFLILFGLVVWFFEPCYQTLRACFNVCGNKKEDQLTPLPRHRRRRRSKKEEEGEINEIIQTSSVSKLKDTRTPQFIGIDRVDAPVKQHRSPFRFFGLFRRSSRKFTPSGKHSSFLHTQRKQKLLGSVYPIQDGRYQMRHYQHQDIPDGVGLPKSESYESFETMTTDSEFYRDWRHSIDFGPPTTGNDGQPLNAMAANNDWALQMAYEQQLQSTSGQNQIATSPLSLPESSENPPELTAENATELVSSNGDVHKKTTTTTMTTSSSSKTRTSSIFERFIRRPMTSSTPALNELDANNFVNDSRPEVMDNQINKQRARMAEVAAAIAGGENGRESNRTGALDTNMNVLYI